jgi:major membrane immunogen (membrane-anchored lipoprotein)
MNRHLVPLLLGTVVLVGGCGRAGEVAVGGTGSPPAATPHKAPDPHPTAAPWPAYDVPDYTYTLRTSCFCGDRGVPVTITVRDGKVVDAVYAHRGWGHAAGDPAGAWMRVSINDVIDAANDQDADQVRVVWPKGLDHPTSVWVDPDANAADEEIGYSVHDVTPE